MTGKISAKLVNKKFKLLLSREELIWTCSDAVKHVWNFEHFCAFRFTFLPHLEWTIIVIELPVTILSLGCLYFGILVSKVNSILHAGFLHIQFTATPTVCLFSWFLLFKYILSSLIQLVQNSWEKNQVGTKLTRLTSDLSQNNWLTCVVFFHVQLSPFFCSTVLSHHVAKNIWFLLFRLFTCVWRLYFLVFSQILTISKKMVILLYSASFCPLKSKINSFLGTQFSQLLLHGKDIIFRVFLKFYISSSFFWYF